MDKLLITLLFFCFTISISAQKDIKIKSLQEMTGDLSAQVKERRDNNNKRCALIKVQYPTQGATFEGNVMGDVAFEHGEYWVYVPVPKGKPLLHIHLPNATSTIILDASQSSQLGIENLEEGVTYTLIFLYPSTFQTSFYLEAGMLLGSTMGPEVSVGTYLGGFNIEAYALMPMVAKENVYCQSENQAPLEFSYKPSIALGANLGYGIMAAKNIRVTPQIGIRYMEITETAVSNTSLTPAKGANSAAATIGCKLQYMLSKNFGVCIEPEYAINVAKSKGWEALSNASSNINKWNNGIGIKAAVSVEF